MIFSTIRNHRTHLTLIAALAATWIAGAAQAQFLFSTPITTTVQIPGIADEDLADLLDRDDPIDDGAWDDYDLDEDLGEYDSYVDDDDRAVAVERLGWERSGLAEHVGDYDDFADDISRLEAAGQAGFTEVLVGIANLMVGWFWIPDGGFDAVDGLEPDDFGCLPADEDDEDIGWDGGGDIEVEWDNGDDEDGDDADGFWGGEGAPFPMLTATADLRSLMADMLR